MKLKILKNTYTNKDKYILTKNDKDKIDWHGNRIFVNGNYIVRTDAIKSIIVTI